MRKTKGRIGKKAHITKMRKSRKGEKSLRRRRKTTIRNRKNFRGAKRLLEPSEIANKFGIPIATTKEGIRFEFEELNSNAEKIKSDAFVGTIGISKYFADRLNEVFLNDAKNARRRRRSIVTMFTTYIKHIAEFERDNIDSTNPDTLMSEIIKHLEVSHPEILDELNSRKDFYLSIVE